jgi:hypothetical protein
MTGPDPPEKAPRGRSTKLTEDLLAAVMDVINERQKPRAWSPERRWGPG